MNETTEPFIGTHFLSEDVFYVSEDEGGFWLASEFSPYMEAYESVIIEDDVVLNKYGSSIPLLKVRNILVPNNSE